MAKMSGEDEAAIRGGVRVVLKRQARAWNDFVETLRTFGAGEHAAKVGALYRGKLKLVKYDGSRYTVKHGAALNADVIARAVEMVKD